MITASITCERSKIQIAILENAVIKVFYMRSTRKTVTQGEDVPREHVSLM